MPKASKPQGPPKDIWAAIEAGDVEATQRFLDAGTPVEAVDPYGNTLLGQVASGALYRPNRVELARLLLSRGADPNHPQSYGQRVLFGLAYGGNDELCRLLIDHGANIDGIDGPDRHTLLQSASAGGLVWLVERCLGAGQSVESKSAQGHTSLQYAVDGQSYRTDRVKDVVGTATRLLEAGADVHYDNAGTGWGTALHWAASRGTPEGVALLLDRGAKLDARATPGGEQPIHSAALWGPPGCVEVLLQRGADANALDDAGWTPLHCAARHGNVDKVRLLLAAGARPDAVSTASRRVMGEVYAAKKTPLDVATRKKAKEVVALLTKATKAAKPARSGTGSRPGRPSPRPPSRAKTPGRRARR